MKHSLMEHVVCPQDGTKLTLAVTQTRADEIIDGILTCELGHEYEITNGIPRLVPEQVRTPDEETTRSSFSAKWKRIPDFGFDRSSRDIYVNWYLQRYGFGDIEGLKSFLQDRRMVLDAGTGLGRDTMLYAENCHGLVFGLDISDSIDFAYQHVGHLPNVHILQADLTRLPFRRGVFDYVASDQVIHHTPDTEASFRHLAEFVAPAGQIAVYVYKKKGPIREFSDDFLRSKYTAASEEECYRFSRSITLLGKALSDLNIEFDVPEDIPALEIKAGRQNLQRFIYWSMLKCYWNDDLDLETNVMTNFDWYHPLHAHRHTPDEVKRWCSDSGLEIVHFDVVESGISVRASKPAADRDRLGG